MDKKVYVLTRTMDGDVVVDGVFTTEKKAEKYKINLLKDFGVDLDDYEAGSTEYDFEIHSEKLI